MNIASLSLEQTPPLSVPLRFFLTAPLFAMAAALLLVAYGGDALANRWMPVTLGMTHLLTLGFLAMVMVGATQQLLPVLVGAPVPRPRLVSGTLHLLLTAGTLFLVAGMVGGVTIALHAAAALLGAGFLLFVAVVGWCLLHARSGHFTVVSMSLAIVALAVTVAFGVYLAIGLSGSIPPGRQYTDLHLGWGLLGWVALLIMGVAYQVVPMFQITPDYPRWLMHGLGPALFSGLVLWTAGRYGGNPVAVLAFGLLVASGLVLFALATLDLQRRRKRRLPDVTLSFWRLAMLSLLAAVVLWGSGHLFGGMPELLLGTLVIVGFALSAINGMLYKIVPFLVWLHLNNFMQSQGQWQGRVPNMKKVIPEKSMRLQFRLQLAALVLLLSATLFSPLSRPAGLVFLASMALLAWNLFGALQLYRRTVAG